MTDISVTIEGMSDELWDAYVASGMDRAKAGRSTIDWTFASSPTPFAVARVGGRIVGLSAYIQTRMKLGKKEGTALQAVDSYVSDEMRGKGVFTMIARAYNEHAQRSGADVVWGFPNDNAAPA